MRNAERGLRNDGQGFKRPIDLRFIVAVRGRRKRRTLRVQGNAFWLAQPATRNPQSATRNPQPATRNSYLNTYACSITKIPTNDASAILWKNTKRRISPS